MPIFIVVAHSPSSRAAKARSGGSFAAASNLDISQQSRRIEARRRSKTADTPLIDREV